MDTGGGKDTTSSTNDTVSRAGKVTTGESSKSKAAASGDNDEAHRKPPPNKRKKRPVCKYSTRCYQTGARHREQFDHAPVGSGQSPQTGVCQHQSGRGELK